MRCSQIWVLKLYYRSFKAALPPPQAFENVQRATSGEEENQSRMECTICFSPMGPGKKAIGVGKCGHSYCYTGAMLMLYARKGSAHRVEQKRHHRM